MINTEQKDLRKKLGDVDIMYVLLYLIRFPKLYHSMGSHITNTCFKYGLFELHDEDDIEYMCMCLYQGLTMYYAEQRTLDPPTRVMLEQYTRAYIRTGIPIREEWEDRLFSDSDESCSLISEMYSDEYDSLNEVSGVELIRQFLVERSVLQDLIFTVGDMTDGDTVDMKLADKLTSLRDQANRIATAGIQVGITPTVPSLEDLANIPMERLLSTGVPFVDSGLGGGQREGEVNGLIGPTGAGKSTLGIQLLIGNARSDKADSLMHGYPEKVCVYYTYEQCVSELRVRMWSAAMKIDSASLSITRGLENPSTPGNYKPYELELWPTAITSEIERWEENARFLNDGIVLRNMSGVRDFGDDDRTALMKQQMGCGGVAELVSDLQYIQQSMQKDIRAVFIDYAGIMCERQIGYLADPKQHYMALKSVGDRIRQEVAGRFNCCVWLLHQMSGAATGKSPLVPLHHSDAADCKSLVNNMANCLCLGNPAVCSEDPGEGKCLYLNFSKTRNAAGNDPAVTTPILQRDKHFWLFNNVTDTYSPYPATKCFMKH